jgi:glycine cleavage system aminomethyltransferase T
MIQSETGFVGRERRLKFRNEGTQGEQRKKLVFTRKAERCPEYRAATAPSRTSAEKALRRVGLVVSGGVPKCLAKSSSVEPTHQSKPNGPSPPLQI